MNRHEYNINMSEAGEIVRNRPPSKDPTMHRVTEAAIIAWDRYRAGKGTRDELRLLGEAHAAERRTTTLLLGGRVVS